MESTRYMEHRKKRLIKLRGLLIKRLQLNNKIRQVRKEMYGWDSALIEDD